MKEYTVEKVDISGKKYYAVVRWFMDRQSRMIGWHRIRVVSVIVCALYNVGALKDD